jgi:hypothetical protein
MFPVIRGVQFSQGADTPAVFIAIKPRVISDDEKDT